MEAMEGGLSCDKAQFECPGCLTSAKGAQEVDGFVLDVSRGIGEKERGHHASAQTVEITVELETRQLA